MPTASAGAGGTYQIHADRVHSLTVDGVLYHMDIYSSQQIFATIHLEPGTVRSRRLPLWSHTPHCSDGALALASAAARHLVSCN